MDSGGIKVTEAVVATVTPKPGDVLFVNLRSQSGINYNDCEKVQQHIKRRFEERGIEITVIVTSGLDGFDLATVNAEQLDGAGYVKAADVTG